MVTAHQHQYMVGTWDSVHVQIASGTPVQLGCRCKYTAKTDHAKEIFDLQSFPKCLYFVFAQVKHNFVEFGTIIEFVYICVLL